MKEAHYTQQDRDARNALGVLIVGVILLELAVIVLCSLYPNGVLDEQISRGPIVEIHTAKGFVTKERK